jgi:pyruvate,water dikinase
MPAVLPLTDITADARPLVGGKALGLARLLAAGLPVPPGFVVTADAADSDVIASFQMLGGPVAVRSSAGVEDGADASFAGQFHTTLNVTDEAGLLDAIRRCRQSALRAEVYCRQQGVAASPLSMAVVVQRMVPAEVAGVLFTRDPTDPSGERMCVEAAWGLGEVVVAGRVTPDRFTVRRDTGEVLTQVPGVKTIEVTAAGDRPVPADRQTRLCLDDRTLVELAELGRRVEGVFGIPVDVEWAIADDRVWLLQARPITATTTAEWERMRAEVIAEAGRLADPAGTVWARLPSCESLPAAPTPMTWAVLGRLFAVDGGFGSLHRDLGFDPDPTLGGLGEFDRIAGRPMANLSRLPRLQFRRPPYEYPFATLKADPCRALDPTPVPNPLRAGVLRLPAYFWRAWRIRRRLDRLLDTFAAVFWERADTFQEQARQALDADWTATPPDRLLTHFHWWTKRTTETFGPTALLPAVLAEYARARLAERLTPQAVAEVAVAAVPPEVCVSAGVRALAAGRLDRATFLRRFGHRGHNEMELARPRWGEDPAAMDRLARATDTSPSAPPTYVWYRIAAEAKLTGSVRRRADRLVRHLRQHLGLREEARHHLMLGFAVLRRLLVELDTRFGLNGDIFLLTPAELPDLIANVDLSPVLRERRKRRRLEQSLEMPPVLFSDDLEAIGRQLPAPASATVFQGVPLSAGVAEAPALVLGEPADPPDEPFVLVCPSTDPAWVPLFSRAAAAVLETGGVLSHGAIVAREFGLPAVSGVPGITRVVRTGQRVRVDGGRGTVTVCDHQAEG